MQKPEKSLFGDATPKKPVDDKKVEEEVPDKVQPKPSLFQPSSLFNPDGAQKTTSLFEKPAEKIAQSEGNQETVDEQKPEPAKNVVAPPPNPFMT